MFDYINYDSDVTTSRQLSMVMIQRMINISDGRDDADSHVRNSDNSYKVTLDTLNGHVMIMKMMEMLSMTILKMK
jgi:hypothetical protein